MSALYHTVPGISQEASGPSYSVTRLCEELTYHDFDIELLVIDDGNEALGKSFLRGFPPGFGPRKLGNSPKMHHWLRDQARYGKPLLLHTHSLWMMPNVYPGWIAKKYNIPLVVSPRGTLSAYSMATGSIVKKLYWPILQKPVLQSATCFHATSYAEYLDIRRMGFNQPVAIIPNGIDERPAPLKSNSKTRTLLYLGRIHPEKGIEHLLYAWKDLKNVLPKWRLRIVGPCSNNYIKELKTLSQNLNLCRVDFRGPAYGEEKFQEYRNCDLFVLPSPSENFGMVVAEALMAGRPVITTTGTPWENLVKNNAGWWVETKKDAIKSAIIEAANLSNEELLKIGDNGRNWMIRDYSWKQIGADLAATYRWILNNDAKPDNVKIG